MTSKRSRAFFSGIAHPRYSAKVNEANTAAGHRPFITRSPSSQVAVSPAAGQRPPLGRAPSSQMSKSSATTSIRSASTTKSVAGPDTRNSGSQRSSAHAAALDAGAVPQDSLSDHPDFLTARHFGYFRLMDPTTPLQRVLMPQATSNLPPHYTFVNDMFTRMLRDRYQPAPLRSGTGEKNSQVPTDYNLLKPTAESSTRVFRDDSFRYCWHNFGQLRFDNSNRPPKIKLRFSTHQGSMEITSALNEYGGSQSGFYKFRRITNICGLAVQGEGILVVSDWELDRRKTNQPTCTTMHMVGFYSEGSRILSHPSNVLPEVEKASTKWQNASWSVTIGDRFKLRVPFRENDLVLFRLAGGSTDQLMEAYGIRRVVAH